LFDRSASSLIPLPGLNDPAFADFVPSLSADGRFIAFSSDRNGLADVFVYDRSTSSLVSLPGLNEPGIEDSYPAIAFSGFAPSGKVSGGGQIDVNMTGVRGSFGFNAKGSGSAASGHLNYMNHFTGAHVDCSVNAVMQLTATKVRLCGTTCSPRSTSASFTADVEDKANPGKGADTFRITYNNNMMITTTDEGTLTSGDIKIHK